MKQPREQSTGKAKCWAMKTVLDKDGKLFADVRVAVQRVVRSIGFTLRRDGYLLRLHTGRVTAKFRIAKRRPG